MTSIGKGTKRAIIALAVAGTAGAAIYLAYTKLKKRPGTPDSKEKTKTPEQTSPKKVVSPSVTPATGPAKTQTQPTKPAVPPSSPQTRVVPPTPPTGPDSLTESTGSGSLSLSSSFVHVDTPPSSMGSVSQPSSLSSPKPDPGARPKTAPQQSPPAAVEGSNKGPSQFKTKEENDIVVIEEEKSVSSSRAGGDATSLGGARSAAPIVPPRQDFKPPGGTTAGAGREPTRPTTTTTTTTASTAGSGDVKKPSAISHSTPIVGQEVRVEPPKQSPVAPAPVATRLPQLQPAAPTAMKLETAPAKVEKKHESKKEESEEGESTGDSE